MPAAADVFGRSIRLRRVDDCLVTASVEDDFHHFELTIAHRRHRVEDVLAKTLRAPWTTCPGAAAALHGLVGTTLIERASDVGLLIDMRAQCTHMFDLAGLLLAFARRGDMATDYDATAVLEGQTFEAGLDREGKSVLRWFGRGDRVAADPPVSLGRGFRAWTEAMAVEPAEHAFVLRRAIFVARGRREPLEEWKTPDDLGLPVDVCHSLGRELRREARRTIGTRVDFAAVRSASRHPR